MKLRLKEERRIICFQKNLLSLLLSAVILSIRVISDFRVDERRGISSCLRCGDEAEVTIRYFLSVGQERGSERERAFIVREEEEAAAEKEEEGDGEGGTRKEQMEEEGITVPSFPRPANSFLQGSRTLSTEPNSKVIAPVPAIPRGIPILSSAISKVIDYSFNYQQNSQYFSKILSFTF